LKSVRLGLGNAQQRAPHAQKFDPKCFRPHGRTVLVALPSSLDLQQLELNFSSCNSRKQATGEARDWSCVCRKTDSTEDGKAAAAERENCRSFFDPQNWKYLTANERVFEAEETPSVKPRPVVQRESSSSGLLLN